MTGTPTPQALIYARISQDREGAGLGVDRQLADCRALAERLGWTVVGVHTDNDISAYSGKRRPGYRALLDDLQAGRASGVLVWHTDRLHRSPVELEEYIGVCQDREIATHSVQAGNLDLATASGRMVARMLGSAARFESEHKGDRIRAARQQAAQDGRWQGGVRPFGFEPDGVTIRPAEAAKIVAATDALLAGAGLRSVVRELNDSGVRTTFKAHAWSPNSWRDVMLRPRNAGLCTYRGEIVGPASWPPIVPEDRWRAVVSLLTNPGRRTSPASSRVKWLGSGLYLCGVCGNPWLRVSGAAGKGPAYRCGSREFLSQASGHVTRNARALDDYVEGVVLERLSRADAVELLRGPADGGVDTDGLHREAVTLRQRLTDLSGAFAEGAVTMAQLRDGTGRLRSRLGEIDATIGAAAAVDPLVGLVGVDDPAAVWEGLDVGRRRAALEVLLTVIVLPADGTRGPGGERFNPKFVRIVWQA